MTRMLAWSLAAVARLLALTWRWEITGAERLGDLPAEAPRLWVLWHGEMLPLLWFHRARGIAILASRHRDGGYLASAAGKWGYRVVRGSSTRSGTGALRAMIRVLASGGQAALTLDGPRGPRHRAKPGGALAAQRTGAAVVPVRAQASRAWQLPSWDGFVIPAPFARIRIVYGAPLRLARGVDARSTGREQIERRLEGLVA